MFKRYVHFAAIIALSAALTVTSGCGRAKEKMKMPTIKMVTSDDVIAVSAPDENNVWVAGDFGVIYRSADSGETWTEQKSGVDTLLCDIKFLDDTYGWAAGIKGVMLHTTDGGATWKRQDPGTKRHLLAIWFADKDRGWAVGEYSTILHTKDGGNTWTRQNEESDKIFNKVCFVDRENGWIIGEAGIMLRTANGGATWEPVVPEFFKREGLEEEYDNPRPTLFGLYFADKQHGWICGMDSTIMRTTDGGSTWELLKTKKGEPLYNIFVKADRGWAVGNKGTYLLSHDGGMTWGKQDESIKSKLLLANVVFSSRDKGWIVGAAGTILKTTDAGESWSFCSGLSYIFEGFKMPEGLEKNIIE
ncbi:MAG: YCF48-related protein [Proteobacteria bacterium]|nr:YCF48-related protein [Pseudomonadota bacterium]